MSRRKIILYTVAVILVILTALLFFSVKSKVLCDTHSLADLACGLAVFYFDVGLILAALVLTVMALFQKTREVPTESVPLNTVTHRMKWKPVWLIIVGLFMIYGRGLLPLSNNGVSLLQFISPILGIVIIILGIILLIINFFTRTDK